MVTWLESDRDYTYKEVRLLNLLCLMIMYISSPLACSSSTGSSVNSTHLIPLFSHLPANEQRRQFREQVRQLQDAFQHPHLILKVNQSPVFAGKRTLTLASECSQLDSVFSTHVPKRCFHAMSMSPSRFSSFNAARSSNVSIGWLSSSLCVLAETWGSATSFHPPHDKSDSAPVSSMPRIGRALPGAVEDLARVRHPERHITRSQRARCELQERGMEGVCEQDGGVPGEEGAELLV